MNYSRKNSDGVFTKLFSSILKAGAVLAAAALLCGSMDYEAEEPQQELITVEVPHDIQISHIETRPSFNEVGDVAAVEETASDGFVNPTEGVLTSAFGERWGRMHDGIDIGADTDTEIYASDGGTVVCAEAVSGYGNYVVIAHDNGFETAYAHCNSIAVSAGETVEKGQVIAYVGSTGNSTGPHLHFEVRQNGDCLNPLDYVMY